MTPRDNHLLRTLPADELEALARELEPTRLEHEQLLILPNEPIRFVYFPVTALASLVAVLEDGSTVESGAVGREGMVGVPFILGANTTPMQTLVQVPGDGYRIPSEALKVEYDRRGALHAVLNRYVHTLFVVASQSAACNRKHTVDARLARWLLMSSDGINSHNVGITQEYLAVMLGVRRAGVTEAAVKLQNRGIIRYSRGSVQILDRPELESRACECYHIVRSEYERLFGTSLAPTRLNPERSEGSTEPSRETRV